MSARSMRALFLAILVSCLFASSDVVRADPTIQNGGFDLVGDTLPHWELPPNGTTGPCPNSVGTATSFCPLTGRGSYVFLGDSDVPPGNTSNHKGYVRQRGIVLPPCDSIAFSFFLSVGTQKTTTDPVDELVVSLRSDDLPNNDPVIDTAPAYSNLNWTGPWDTNGCTPYVQKTVLFQIPAQYQGTSAVLDFRVSTSGTVCNVSEQQTIFRIDAVAVAYVGCPTLSTWGLSVMTLLILTAATIVIMRRRAAVA